MKSGRSLSNEKGRPQIETRVRMINIPKVLIGTNYRDSSDTCGMPDAAYDRVNSEYGRGTINFPNEDFIHDYKERLLKPDAYDDFLTCPSGVWFAAIAHYFMIAVMSWMACEGIHLYFQVVAVLSRPRHKYLTKLSLFGKFQPRPSPYSSK